MIKQLKSKNLEKNISQQWLMYLRNNLIFEEKMRKGPAFSPRTDAFEEKFHFRKK